MLDHAGSRYSISDGQLQTRASRHVASTNFRIYATLDLKTSRRNVLNFSIPSLSYFSEYLFVI